MPRSAISLLALGGTIASPVDAVRGADIGLDAAGVAAAVPGLAEVADVTARTFRSTMSSALSLADVIALGRAIDEEFAAGAVGVVVTMGTDSLEEVAFALDHLVVSRRPVVVTGAMRNAGVPGADGPANLLTAVRVAASSEAADLGVLVVLHDEIHAARAVRKTHSASPAAFTSPGLGPLGWVVEGRVRLPLAPRRPIETLTPITDAPPVALVRLALGEDGRLVDAIGDLGYAGAVVEVFGAGHVGGTVMPSLRRLAERMPVVFASRTGAGELYAETGRFVGSETDLLASGLISAGALDGLKARMLLTLLLAAGTGPTDIAEAFARAANG